VGCGAGPIPSFATPATPGFTTPQHQARGAAQPAEESFAGFDGFDEEEEEAEHFDERAGWTQEAHAQRQPPKGQQQQHGAARQPDWGDVSVLAAPPPPTQAFVDYSQLEGLGARRDDDEVDWGILTAPPVADKPRRGGQPAPAADMETGGKGDDEEDDEFTVFDGFGQDNKPVKAASGTAGREGMSWNAERKAWERQNQRAYGGRAGGGSPWDLRSATFRSPASLLRMRSQAAKVFDDAISDSIFKSPSIQRIRARTDEMFADLTASVSSVTTVFTDTASYFRSWFS